VTVENVASGDAEHQLEAGWPAAGRPDVWTPAATTWVQLLESSKRADLVPSGRYPLIANSPLVIAMPDPMARALGWPKYHPTWRDFLLLAQDPRGWAQYRHPTWGPFTLGKTDPRTSTSGIHSLIAEYEAATGTNNPTKTDINAAATTAFMTAVEASVSHYASTAGSFLDNMALADPLPYVSAVAVEEQEVFNYNEGGHSPLGTKEAPLIPLDAIYPAGTFVADHPFVILRGSWVTRAKSNIANDFLNWLQQDPQQSRFARAGFRNYAGGALPPLSTEPGIPSDKPTKIDTPTPDVVSAMAQNWSNLRKPARILMVLDLANTTEQTLVDRSINELADRDQVGVWAVARGQPLQLLPLTTLGGAHDSVLHAIDSAPTVGGPTPLYSDVGRAYESLRLESDADHVDAIVIITAHRDDGTGERLAALEREIRAQGASPAVRIYAVAFPGSDGDSLLGIEGASGGVPAAWNDPTAAIRTSLGNF
jgi:Ca-activated chloride channel family protein